MLVEAMWLFDIKCFDMCYLPFARDTPPPQWITLLGENGGGKSTALQALGLLLAGPEGAQKLLPRPLGWVRDEERQGWGRIAVRIRQGKSDPGKSPFKKDPRALNYSFRITGSHPTRSAGRLFTEPTIAPYNEPRLKWLRENAFTSQGSGWFAAGYGPFRRLNRSSELIVPSLEAQTRFANFRTQFDEREPLSTFERWLVYLDYRSAKARKRATKEHLLLERGIEAINKLLPHGARFHSVSKDGRVLFVINGKKVPTLALSDGYRSVLALAGDLVWRLLLAFPNSRNPLHEEGVVLVDELDIHLHPSWQRFLPMWLQEQFPNIQFIVATHSPLIAAGAGDKALTLRFRSSRTSTSIEKIPGVSAKSVDDLLLSSAFDLPSTHSPITEASIERYDILTQKGKRRTRTEAEEYRALRQFMEEARPIGGSPEPGTLDAKIEDYLRKALT
jgi:energy-coupling factor transporter ATP-binding protein EcfA2